MYPFAKCKACAYVHAYMGKSWASQRSRWIYECTNKQEPPECDYKYDKNTRNKPWNTRAIIQGQLKNIDNTKEETRKMKVDLGKLGMKKTEDGYETEKKSLKSSDLGKRGTIVDALITKAAQGEYGDEEKIVLTLTIPDMKEQGIGKLLPLNKTNLKACLESFGDELDNWENKMIELRVESTTYAGDTVDCIRLYPKG